MTNVHDIAATFAAEEAEVSAWEDGLILSKSGAIRPTLTNALHAFRTCPAWEGVLRFNSFAQRIEVAKPTPWGYRGPWIDRQIILACDWVQKQGIEVGVEVTSQAIHAAAGEHSFHPVQAWLKGLTWDCKPRLESWLSVYLGAEPSAYISSVGKCALISGVARAMNPGAKVDSMLILEAPQGAGKSQACAILGGGWFADEISDLGSKDAAMQLQGVWLLELSELDAMSRAEAARIKAFLTRTEDHYRPPYGRAVIDQPRSSWFIGTTNGATYLRDETGGRRFWPVRCGRIDLGALRRDREQLFAEARVLFEAGAHWWLEDGAAMAEATQEQGDRFDTDVWHDSISYWLGGREMVTIDEVLQGAIKKDLAHWTQADKLRASRVLLSLGWRYTRRRSGTHGTRQYVFLPPEGAE